MSWGARLVVVKDYGRRNWVGRWLGRMQIRREEKVYRRLGGIDGVPPFLGMIDRYSFAIAHVRGRPIDQYQFHELGLIDKILDRLRELIGAIHRRGVAHFDLRRRNNVLVDDNGNVHLIDFAGSMWFRPGSWGARRVFPWLQKVDESAFLKWKQRLAPDSMSEKELSRLRKITRLRGWWFFNRPGGRAS
jgi:serine/threonine protein kinase